MLRLTSVYCCPCPSKSYMSLSSNQEDRYNWNTICLHTDCFLSVAIGLHSMTLSRVIGLHSTTLLCLDREGGGSENLDKLSAKRFFSPDKCFLRAFLFEDKKFPTLIPLHPHQKSEFLWLQFSGQSIFSCLLVQYLCPLVLFDTDTIMVELFNSCFGPASAFPTELKTCEFLF